MLVYLPASIPTMRAWVLAGEVGPAPLIGYAVTPGLRAWYVDADAEELQYAAQARAAGASLRLLHGAPPRRAVVVVEVDEDAEVEVRDDLDEGAVRLLAPVAFGLVQAGFVDAADAETAVAQAVSAIDAADLGDPDAEFFVSEAEDHDLGWYAAQELSGL